jgi:phage shock protein PspC (stress-responsive transcriptional regulator)
MNETDTGHQAYDQIPPQPADQPDDQPASDQPQGDQPRADQPRADQPPAFGPIGSGPLYRPYDDRIVAGVAAGLARYINVDAMIVRIVLAVLTVMGGFGLLIYLAGWLLIPDEGASQSIADDFIGSLQGRSW